MHNSTLMICLIIFFLCFAALTIAMLFNISNKQSQHEKIYIEDQQLKILNRVEGIEGPAIRMSERIQTSLYACNKTDKPVIVASSGVFRKEGPVPIIVVVDPTSTTRESGCQTIIRMSPGSAASRGLTPGTWYIEGTRTVREGLKELQRLPHKSESFQVVP